MDTPTPRAHAARGERAPPKAFGAEGSDAPRDAKVA